MRAVRVAHEGKVYGGLEEDDQVRVVPEEGLDVVALIAKEGWDGLERKATRKLAREETVLLAPVPNPQKILCVGLNYRDHVVEQNLEPPDHPIVFAKMPSAVIGPGDAIPMHEIASQIDYEAELAVVILSRTRGISPEDAFDVVAGYTAVNDVSARNLQFSDGQWVRAKSLDGYAPMGPVLVSPDAVGEPDNLDIRCYVNGELRQDSNTKNLIFDVPTLISFCAEAMTLQPGDIICTGTPSGVGVFMDPPRFLEEGDIVTVYVEEIGELTNPVGSKSRTASVL